MELLLLQTDIIWNDPQANFRNVCGLVSSAGASAASGGVDVIVLPEMFTTGFAVSPGGIAEPNGGAQTLEWMRELARETNAAVVGSVAVEENKRFHNRMFFVKPDGSHAAYDKRHLFSFGGEDKTCTAGTERVVVEWRGWRILLQVCYDLRFPVFARNRGPEGDYDMIIYSASWPTVRLDVWNTLLKARAIENQCYVAGVNRVGSDPSASYSGGTQLIDHKGRIVAAADERKEQAIAAGADLDTLQAFRRKFPALADADRFTLG